MVEGYLKVEIGDVSSDTEEQSSGDGPKRLSEPKNITGNDTSIAIYNGDGGCSSLGPNNPDVTATSSDSHLTSLLQDIITDDEPHISIIEKMLEDGEATIVPDRVKSAANLSVVWKLFGFVTTKDGRVFKFRILCTLCRKSFIYQKDGNTSTMLRHLRKYHADDVGLPPIPEERPRKKIEAKIMESLQRFNNATSGHISNNCSLTTNSDSQGSISNTFPTTNTTSTNNTSALVSYMYNSPLNDDRQEEIDLAIAKFLVKELQSFSIVNNPAFQEMIHTCMNVHKEPFPQLVYKVPDKKSLNQQIIPWLYVNVKQRIFDNLYKAQNNDLNTTGPTGTITMDIWSDAKQKRHYLTMAFRFLDDTFQLHWWNLGTRQFEGPDIGSKVLDVMSEYGLKAEEQIFVTDSNSHIVKACKDNRWSRITCFGHDLNALVESDMLRSEETKEIKEVLEGCQEVISYIKRSGLTKKLEKLQQEKHNYDSCPLKQGISNCLNSQIHMLESVLKNFDHIIEILIASHEHNLVSKLNREKIKQLLDLLKPLEETTKMFTNQVPITICLFWPAVHCIKTHLTADLNEIFPIKQEKRSLINQGFSPQCLMEAQENMLTSITSRGHNYHQRLKITKIHRLATILDPRFRSLRFCSLFEREQVIKELTYECKFIINHRLDAQKPENYSAVCVYENGVAVKKRKVLDISQLYDEAEDDSELLEINKVTDLHQNLAENEVKYYTHLKLNHADFSDPEYPLKFWKEYGHHLPELAILARKYLSLSATAVLPEWRFTKMGDILNEKRSCLPAEAVDNVLFLHQNL